MTRSQLVLILQLISGESGASVFLDQSRSEEKQNLRSTSIHNWKFLCGLLDMHHTQTCYALTALKCHELTQKWPWSKTFMKKGNFGSCIYNNNKAEKKQTEKTNRNNSALNMYHGSKRRKVHHRLALRPQMNNLLLQKEIKQRQRILFFLMIESKILRNPLLIDNLLTHEFVTVKKKTIFNEISRTRRLAVNSAKPFGSAA